MRTYSHHSRCKKVSSGLLLSFPSVYFAQGWWYSLVEQLSGGLREADHSSQ